MHINVEGRAALNYSPTSHATKASRSLQQHAAKAFTNFTNHAAKASRSLQQHRSYQCKSKEEEEEDGDSVIDKESFNRVFDIAAVRVPSQYCFVLESRIRGHLLNWPRIRNIAKVPGDEVEEEVVTLLGESHSGSGEDSI
ncbi:unnamed protein product [Linum trigynum]|uniref:Uncharacterized protein n=1 Tax=Linum trigynum TaxID=586398 RepID=A0AAV2FA79_9ROSI